MPEMVFGNIFTEVAAILLLLLTAGGGFALGLLAVLVTRSKKGEQK